MRSFIEKESRLFWFSYSLVFFCLSSQSRCYCLRIQSTLLIWLQNSTISINQCLLSSIFVNLFNTSRLYWTLRNKIKSQAKEQVVLELNLKSLFSTLSESDSKSRFLVNKYKRFMLVWFWFWGQTTNFHRTAKINLLSMKVNPVAFCCKRERISKIFKQVVEVANKV